MAQTALGLTYAETAQLYDADTVNGDGAVGRNRLGNTLLRGTPDVDVHYVARTQAVILWRSEVHRTLERHFLVVEDVVTENLTAFLLLLQLIIKIFQRVGHHEVHRIVHHHELLVVFVVGVTLRLGAVVLDAEFRNVTLLALLFAGTLLAVGLAHAGLYALAACSDVVSSQRAVFRLALVLLLDTANLVDGDTALHQLCDNLLARHAVGVLFYHEIHHLVVGHA